MTLAEPVLQGVRVENAGAVQAALADNGTLAFLSAAGAQRTSLVWVSRSGEAESLVEERRTYSTPRISPDGAKVAVVVNDDGNTDIWIVDLGTGSQRQLTTRGDATSPTWTPNGSAIAFAAGSDEVFAIRLIHVETRDSEELVTGEHPLLPMAWFEQGRQLVYLELSVEQDIFVLDTEAQTSTVLLPTSALEESATLSRDGSLLAYESDRTGVREVYVREFPAGGEIQVSTNGGMEPVWSPDDSELFYRGLGDTRVLAASIRAQRRLEVVGQEELFISAPYWMGLIESAYDVASDGRFLMVRHRDRSERSSRPRARHPQLRPAFERAGARRRSPAVVKRAQPYYRSHRSPSGGALRWAVSRGGPHPLDRFASQLRWNPGS